MKLTETETFLGEEIIFLLCYLCHLRNVMISFLRNKLKCPTLPYKTGVLYYWVCLKRRAHILIFKTDRHWAQARDKRRRAEGWTVRVSRSSPPPIWLIKPEAVQTRWAVSTQHWRQGAQARVTVSLLFRGRVGFLTKLGLLGPPGLPICISRKEVDKWLFWSVCPSGLFVAG